MPQNRTVNQASRVASEQRTFLLPIELQDLDVPVFAMFTRTQIVEIIEPSAVSWHGSADGAVLGMCSYGADTFPVLDLPKICGGEYATEAPLPAKQVVIVRTGEINLNRSFKIAFSASAPVRSIKLSNTLLDSLKNSLSEVPDAIYNQNFIRGFFTLPQLHLALLDVRNIAKTAEKM